MDALKKLSSSMDGYSLNELRLVVALERAVARLESHPKLSPHLIFKGGFVLLKTVDTPRFTRDVDVLALRISRDAVPSLVTAALARDLDDALWFGDVAIESLDTQGEYGGYRFNCAFQIGDPPDDDGKIKKLSRIHIDMGFGDPVAEMPKKEPMSAIFAESPPVTWSVYPLENIFAEKLEALFSRGSLNSRAKDVYDLPLIFSKCDAKSNIAGVVRHTFNHRRTAIPESFETAARSLDLTTLRHAWRSVQLTGETRNFDEVWRQLLECLTALDLANERAKL